MEVPAGNVGDEVEFARLAWLGDESDGMDTKGRNHLGDVNFGQMA
jgi:hypothetical protein